MPSYLLQAGKTSSDQYYTAKPHVKGNNVIPLKVPSDLESNHNSVLNARKVTLREMQSLVVSLNSRLHVPVYPTCPPVPVYPTCPPVLIVEIEFTAKSEYRVQLTMVQ